MFIYKITNVISGKIYIGQTIRTLKLRWKQHCKATTGCCAIRDSIKKYGKSNFKIELLETCKTQKQLDKKEIYWISKLNCLSPNGYNLKTGGQHGTYSKQAKKKMSIARIGRFSGKDHPRSRSIKCIETNQVFCSLTEASKIMSIQISDICSVLKGIRKHAKNHTFIYMENANG